MTARPARWFNNVLGLLVLIAAGCGEARGDGENTSASSLTISIGEGLLSDEGTVATVEILDSAGRVIDYGAIRASLFDSRVLYQGDSSSAAREMRVTFYPCSSECPPEEAWQAPGGADGAFGPGGRSTCTASLEADEYTVRASVTSDKCEIKPN